MNIFSRAYVAMGIVASLALTACGGGGSSSSMNSGAAAMGCDAATCGSAVLTMTDAQGDFLNYVVTLQSLQLKKANGATVETLPKATQVDFAQLVDLSEILSVGQIPAGDYVGASITVDYTGATLLVDDGSASGLNVSPVDQSGNAVTQLTLTVQLDNKHHLVITPGRISRLAFDFNLLASNTVDTANAKVVVQPMLVASVVPPDTKQIRVRGSLASVDSANSDYVVNVLPFHEESMKVGQVTVHVNAQTSYEIDGAPFKGDAGLAALAALPANSMTAAFGALQTSDMSFMATNVLAGSSLHSPTLDKVTGTVIARSGDVLTVRGIELEHHEGALEFASGNITVNVGSTTNVTEEGQPTGTFDIGAISVGQHVDVFGTMTRDATTRAVTVDATAGKVRLDITPIWGSVSLTTPTTSSTMGSVTLNLQAIDGRPVSIFNFSGTGTSAATDANPSSYVVNTQTLPLTGLSNSISMVGSMSALPTRMFGFVTPFGKAPPDFVAMSLVDYSTVNALLVINWGLVGATAPFSIMNSGDLVLDLSNPNIGLFHELDVGPVHVDLKKLPSSPQIVADTAATTQLYSIGHVKTHSVDNFNTFSDFVTALTTDLGGANVAYGMTAQGHYSSSNGTLSISRALVVLNN